MIISYDSHLPPSFKDDSVAKPKRSPDQRRSGSVSFLNLSIPDQTHSRLDTFERSDAFKIVHILDQTRSGLDTFRIGLEVFRI